VFQSEREGSPDSERTQQLTPIFDALSSTASHRAAVRTTREAFRDDLPTGPQTVVARPDIPVPTRARLRAVPSTRRATSRGAHRAPDVEQVDPRADTAEQPTVRRSAPRGGRHRPLRAVSR
jgi:hypothetical protein